MQEKENDQCHICHRQPRQKRLPCPLPFRVRTTMFATFLRYFLNYYRDLIPRPGPYRDAFLTQMRVLILNSSGRDAMNTGFPNAAFNKHRGKQREEKLLDELLYMQRYCIERTNAWINSYRNVLNRFDTQLSSWKAWNYIAFILFLLKKIRMGEKSR